MKQEVIPLGRPKTRTTMKIMVMVSALTLLALTLLAFPSPAKDSNQGNQISGLITLQDLSEFWFVPAIAVVIMVLYLLYENRRRLAGLVSKKGLPPVESVFGEEAAELLRTSSLSKKLTLGHKKREEKVRVVHDRGEREETLGERLRATVKKLIPAGAPQTVGEQLALGSALKKSDVAFDLERLVTENKDNRALLTAVVGSLRDDFQVIEEKQSNMKARNTKLAKLEDALEELAKLQGTLQAERENFAELKRLHAGLEEITADESTTFEALLREFSEVEQEFTSVSQVCSVIATISSQMRAELATAESRDASFDARKKEIENLQQNAIRLQQLLSEKRERLARLLPAIARMRDEIVKAGIDDLLRLQEARREEATIHQIRVVDLKEQIRSRESEKGEIEARRKALDNRSKQLEAQVTQREQRIEQLDRDLEAARAQAKQSEAAKAQADRLHTKVLAEKERLISALREEKRVVENRRGELARELAAAQEQHRMAEARVGELEAQEISLHESIARGGEAIAAAREALASLERAFEEEKANLSVAEQAKQQEAIAAQERAFNARIAAITSAMELAEGQIGPLRTQLEEARRQAGAEEDARRRAESAVEESRKTIRTLESQVKKKEAEMTRERQAMSKEREKLKEKIIGLAKKLAALRAQRAKLQDDAATLVVKRVQLEKELKRLQEQRISKQQISDASALQLVVQQRRKLIRDLVELIRQERSRRAKVQEQVAERASLLDERAKQLAALTTSVEAERVAFDAELSQKKSELAALEARKESLAREEADLRARIAKIREQAATEVSEDVKEKLRELQESAREVANANERVNRELAEVRKNLESSERGKSVAESELAQARAQHTEIVAEINNWLNEGLRQVQERQKRLDLQQQTIDAERGRAVQAEQEIRRLEESQQEAIAQLQVASAQEKDAEERRLREELQAAHQQEIATLERELARLEGIELACRYVSAERDQLAREKDDLKTTLEKKIGDLADRVRQLNANVTMHSTRCRELEPLVRKTQEQEDELKSLRQELHDAEAVKDSAQRDLDAVRRQLAELQAVGMPASDLRAAEEADEQAHEAKRRQEYLALHTEFGSHMGDAERFDDERNYESALNALDAAENVVQKIVQVIPANKAAPLRKLMEDLRKRISASRSASEQSGIIKTVWALFPVGKKEMIQYGYHGSGKKGQDRPPAFAADDTTIADVFPNLAPLLSVGFVLSTEKLTKENIKIGKSPAASDIVIRSSGESSGASLETIVPVHVSLKLRKGSSELVVVSNSNGTRRARAEDKSWELLPKGTTAALNSPNRLVLGRDLNSPIQFIIAPFHVIPDDDFDKLSSVSFEQFWIAFGAPNIPASVQKASVQTAELPQEVGVLVPTKGNYEIRMSLNGNPVDQIIAYKQETSMGRQADTDIVITAGHKDDIRTISKSYLIKRSDDGSYSIELEKEDPYGGVFMLETRAEGKSQKPVTWYHKIEGPLTLREGAEFSLDREGEFCFVFSKKRWPDLKIVSAPSTEIRQEIHFTAIPFRTVGELKPQGEFAILVDGKEINADRIMLWKDDTIVGNIKPKERECDIKIVSRMLVQNPEGETEGEDRVVASSLISRHHALITYKDGRYSLKDNSTYGTFVQGKKVGKGNTVELQDGYFIIFGSLPMMMEFTTQKIPASEIPKEVAVATVVFESEEDESEEKESKEAQQVQPTHSELPARPAPPAPRAQPDFEEKKEGVRIPALFVQQKNAQVLADGNAVYPMRLELQQQVIRIGSDDNNDIVLHSDIPDVMKQIRGKHARIEIKSNGDVFFIVEGTLFRQIIYYINGREYTTRSKQEFQIVPNLLPDKSSSVRIGFGHQSIEVWLSIVQRSKIPPPGRQWKKAKILFKKA